MSRIIKIQSLKNGSSVIKIKTVANEKYIIADETGKTLNKLKFVQKNKNLEIYTEVDGKEQQVVTLEDYYAPDMNTSVVGLSETNEELAYVYNENDGWYYLLNDTELGFAFPLVGIGAAGAAGAGIAIANNGGGDGGGGTTSSVDTTPPTAGTISLSNFTDTGSSATDNISTDNTFDLTISGQETGSTVVYEVSTDGGVTWTTTTANQSSLTDGTYNFRATVTDASGNSATTPVQTLTVDTLSPIINSSSIATIVENTPNTDVVYDSNATDNGGANDVGITYSIFGGADASKFTIDSATGEVKFITSPDYENPTDVGGNNVYDIIVRATDGAGNSTDKNVAISVTNINEPTLTMSMSPSSGFVPAPIKLEGLNETAGQEKDSKIIKFSDGSYAVAFVGIDSSSSNAYINVQKFNSDSTLDGTITQIPIPLGFMAMMGSEGDYEITALPNGKYVVALVGVDGADESVFVQRFNSDGTLDGSATKLEGDSTSATESDVFITTLSDGSYVVSFTSNDSGGDSSIFLQKFNLDGSLNGSVINLDDSTSVTNIYEGYSQLTALGNGNYVLMNENNYKDTQINLFDENGTLLNTQVINNGFASGFVQDRTITTLSDGSFVVGFTAWDGSSYAAYIQKFNSDGTLDNVMQKLESTNTAKTEYEVKITPLNDGSYVVTFFSQSGGGTDVICVQKFNNDGSLSGSLLEIDAGNGSNYNPEITTLNDGDYVISWMASDPSSGYSIFVQRFNSDGTTQGNIVKLISTEAPTGYEGTPSIKALADGGYVVSFTGSDNNGDESIFVQQFDANGIPVNQTPTMGDLKITTTFNLGDFETMNGYKVTYTEGTLTVDGTTYATGSTVAQSTWETAVANGTVILSGVSSTTYNLIVETTATDAQTGATITLTDTKMGSGMVSPMMLDLDGNGVNTSSFDNGVIFDVNADGKTEQTGWSDGKDGLLVLDLNKDGIINDGSELFGEGTTLADGSKAKDAFEALKQYDENGDDVIDVNDSIFSSLQIWIDANIDGKTNSGELYKLEDLNVKSLDLNSQNTSSIDNGNMHISENLVT